ncbi:MAG: NADH-quinone oxidoreductase subunit N [Planctomycetota bacterium]|jgi:NADH-quinone oxidoreductase subunit N
MNLLAQSNIWEGIDFGRELSLFSPMIVMVCTMLAVVACPIVVGRDARKIGIVAGLGTLLALYFCFDVFGITGNGPASGLSPGASGMLIADNLSVGFQFVLLIFMAGVSLLWWMGSAGTEENAPEFFILLIGSALGMALMVSTANLLMIIIAIETASLPSYALVGFDKRDQRGAEASLKYMVFGAVCAAIMFYGVSLLYGLTGSLDIGVLAHHLVDNLRGPNWLVYTLGLMCFLVGIAFKLSAVPFHFWCPDAFEGAKIEVTTWLSVASKAAGLVLLIRLVTTICAAVEAPVYMTTLEPLAWGIGIMAVATCTVGNLAAYMQTSVKRLLAYSSIAHAGYMMMATAVFIHPSVNDAQIGTTALMMYVIVYMFMNLGAFGVTALVIWDSGSDRLEAFSGLFRRAPWLAVPMLICLMSLVGLPPFAGFIGKWWILLALSTMGVAGMGSLKILAWVLVLAAVINTLISLYYYMRIVIQMGLKDDGKPPVVSPIGGLALVNTCAVALIILFVFVTPWKNTTESFTEDLYQSVALVDGEQPTLAAGVDAGGD